MGVQVGAFGLILLLLFEHVTVCELIINFVQFAFRGN